jgi:hypothetical protein|tara:strand:- start:952 stop:1566 length:615 start_codon:yes stop_codon:yes gene_type:complete
MADFEGWNVDDLYKAFAYAETGSGIDRFQPWIRTRGGKRLGSDAYGPVQMLSSMVSKATQQMTLEGKPLIDFSKEEMLFIERFKKQGEKFYKYGGTDMPKGGKDPLTGEDVSMYDYGQVGDLSKEDRKLYESTAKKIINYELNRKGVGGSLYKLKRAWRFGDEDTTKSDTDYFEKFDKGLRRVLDTKDKASLFPDETLMETMLA